MCGIAGIVKLDPAETVDEARLKRMRDVLRHRGPDGEGLWIDGPVGLGHRRLAIVDVAGGHQPMANEDGTRVDRLQRRDLQPRRAAPRPRGARPSLPHALRHRDDPPPLRGGGRALRRAAARHVRLRASGTGTAAGCCSRATGSASSRCTTRSPISELAVRLGDQGHPRRVADPAALQRGGAARVPRQPLRRRRGDVLLAAFASSLPGHTLTLVARRGASARAATGSCPTAPRCRARRCAERGARGARRGSSDAVRSHLMSDVPLGLFLSGRHRLDGHRRP